jgi:hypothetical protein
LPSNVTTAPADVVIAAANAETASIRTKFFMVLLLLVRGRDTVDDGAR